jgi:dehydrogenase/reductase SDR family member 7B
LELTQVVLPVMRKTSGERCIAFVSSVQALHGIPHRFIYSASKAAGNNWIETLRIELKDEGIHCLSFCPGYVRTNLRQSGLTASGEVLKEEQAKGAITPQKAAIYLRKAITKRKRIMFTDFSGRFVYVTRLLWPSLLEWILHRKLYKSKKVKS